MAHRNLYVKALHTAGAAIFSLYFLIMASGYLFYAQYTQVPVSLNIGHDLTGQDMQNGTLLRWLSAVGIIFNIQVTCPLLTFPIRDIMAGAVAVAAQAVATPPQRTGGKGGDGVECGCGDEETDGDGDVGLELVDEPLPYTTAPSAPTTTAAEPPRPSPTLLTVCTFVTVAAAGAAGVLLRAYFSNICSIIGGVVTVVNSLLLPLAFFHRLSHRRSSPARLAAHAGIAVLALGTAVVGAGGNLCAIAHGGGGGGGPQGGGICSLISAH